VVIYYLKNDCGERDDRSNSSISARSAIRPTAGHGKATTAMSKRIWASLDEYPSPTGGRHRVGRNAANYYFFRALLRHGSFDEYHLFLANPAQVAQFEAGHGPLLEALGQRHRVKLFTRTELADRLRNTDYTVFHQSDHVQWFNPLCRIRNSLQASVPVTAFIHSISYQEYMGRYLEMLQLGAGPGDALVCSSSCGEQVIRNCCQRIETGLDLPPPRFRFEVIPLGIDDDTESDAPPRCGAAQRSAARQRLQLDQHEVIALCFGRFSDFDKMDLFPLLQAFRRTEPLDRPWRLLLAGALHDENYYKVIQLWARAQGLADKVTFVCEPDERAKADLFQAADFFVSVADNPQETFGLTLLEAMAHGLPLVVSDFDGYRELVTDEVGQRVPTIWGRHDELELLQPVMDNLTFHRLAAQSLVVDIPALSEALTRLFDDEPLRLQQAQATQDRFRQEYTHRAIISRLETLWTELKARFADTSGQVSNQTPTAADDPLAMAIFQNFGHYATRFLSPDDQVRATPFATSLLESGSDYPLLSGMHELIDPGEVARVIGQARQAVPAGTLWPADTINSWRGRYLVLWMLKHELLELETQ